MENYYQQFLGIQGVSRPDYYTLLGVQPKEKDSAIITDAAQKRIQQLETQKTPENETAITQILSEITTARDCLLDEKARKQYEFLRLLNESVAEKNASENVTLEKRSAENDGSTGSTTSSATSGMASTMPSGMSAGMPNYVQNLTPQAVPDPTFQAMQMNSAPGMMPGIPQQGMAPNMFMPGMIPGGAPGMAPVQPQGMPQPG
ncbi:MAG: hypothetical protein Q4C70_04505, partial [Planctomycetia bacterium]|nr:hypothetical protein [Planctomycetia bacterium]